MAVLSRRRMVRWLLGSAAFAVFARFAGLPLAHAQARREFTVIATLDGFKISGTDKSEIRVTAGEVVHITFDAQDVPHSFTTVETIAHYRIDRRAEPGKPVSFDFRADQVGEVQIRCKLTVDPKCKAMTSGLSLIVVEPK